MSDGNFKYSHPNHIQTRPHHSQGLPLDGSLKMDSESGFTYRKPVLLERPDFDNTPASSQVYPLSPVTPPSIAPHSVFQHKYTMDDNISFNSYILPNYDTESISTSHSSMVLNAPRPPSNVPISEFYKYTSQGISQIQRATQILIWTAERDIINEDVASAKQGHTFDTTKNIVREMKLKVIDNLRSQGAGFSFFNRPDKEERLEEMENRINIANAEKIKELEKGIQIFQDELDDWKDFSGRVYQRHAEAMDTTQENTIISLEDIDVESMFEDLDETQQEFYLTYCNTIDSNDLDLNETIKETIDPGITQIRQSLNTANQFVLKTQHYTNGRLSSLAKKVRDRSRIIPTEYDQKIPSVFENSQEQRKESELRNVQHMLRLSTRQNSSSSMVEDP